MRLAFIFGPIWLAGTEAGQVETVDVPEPEPGADEAADHRADEAEQGGEDDPPRLLAGHEELGQNPRDQPEHEPQHDAHGEVSRGEASRSLPPSNQAGPAAPPLQDIRAKRDALALRVHAPLSPSLPFLRPGAAEADWDRPVSGVQPGRALGR